MTRKIKNSGLPWEGFVPSLWRYAKLKTYYSFEKGKNAQKYTVDYIGQHEGEYPVYSGQTENNGIMGMVDSFDYNVDECLFSTTVGAKVMTPRILSGRFSLSQNCLIMKQKKECNNHYMFYLLHPLFDYEKGSIPTYMQPSLRIDDLNKFSFFIPNINEQIKIADFLNTKCAEIDALTTDIKSEIETLEAYKRSVITEAVTKGLDKNVAMKDSGVEWIGEIPNTWFYKPIKRLLLVRDGGSWGEDVRDDVEGTICLRIADFDFDKGVFKTTPTDKLTKRKYSDLQILKLRLKEGDILIEKSGGGEKTPVGRAVIFDKKYTALFANFMDRLRFDVNIISPYYVEYWLRAWYSCKSSPFYINQTIGIQNINLSLLLSREYLYYPNTFRQQQIVSFLNAKCSEIDAIIAQKQEQLTILSDYKKSIIYEYVTGKKEVPCHE